MFSACALVKAMYIMQFLPSKIYGPGIYTLEKQELCSVVLTSKHSVEVYRSERPVCALLVGEGFMEEGVEEIFPVWGISEPRVYLTL